MQFIVELEDGVYNSRVDLYLKNNLPECSRSYLQKLIDEGFIKVNGITISKSLKIKKGDTIDVEFKEENMQVTPEEMTLDIVFENKDFVVVNKDYGINTHPVPGEGGNSNTLVNALLYHIKNLGTINGVYRPGIVHRLDKDTSGLLVIAKNDKSMKALAKAIENRTVKKRYLTLVSGIVEDDGYIESYIGRDPDNRQKMTTKNPINPKLAQTEFKVLQTYKNKYTLLEVNLLTGRTHQIRVHLSSIGFPIVGDSTYGKDKVNKQAKEFGLNRQFLHAWKLDFSLFGENYSFEGKLKPDLEKFLDKIK